MPAQVLTKTLPEVFVAHHFTCARLDIWGADATSLKQFRAVAEPLRAANIRIEAILFSRFARDRGRANDTGANLAEVESTAYAEARALVDATRDLVQDYELQNEISLYPGIRVKDSQGREPADFDTPLGRLQAAALRGMSRAIDDVRRTSQLPLRIILGTTDRKFGLLTFMERQGVHFDVVGYHVYPQAGNAPLDRDPWYGPQGALGELAKFKRPVVINEFNSGEIYSGDAAHPGPDYRNKAGDPQTELALRSLRRHLDGIVRQDVADVEAVLFYELCDEPKKKAPENRFGLFFDRALKKPKLSLFVATAFAGGKLSPAERDQLAERSLLPEPVAEPVGESTP